MIMRVMIIYLIVQIIILFFLKIYKEKKTNKIFLYQKIIKPKVLSNISNDDLNKILEIYNKNLIDMKTIIAHYQFKKFCFYFFFEKFI